MFLDRSWPIRGGAADIYMPLHLRPCLNVFTVCRQNLSKIKLCDWPNTLDATSCQALNTTESVEMDRFKFVLSRVLLMAYSSILLEYVLDSTYS